MHRYENRANGKSVLNHRKQLQNDVYAASSFHRNGHIKKFIVDEKIDLQNQSNQTVVVPIGKSVEFTADGRLLKVTEASPE